MLLKVLRQNGIGHLARNWFDAGCAITIAKRAVHKACFQREALIRNSALNLCSRVVSCPQHALRTYSSGRSNLKDGKQNKKKDGKNKTFLTEEELGQVIDVEKFRTQLSKVVEKLKENYVKNLNVRTSVGTVESLKVDFEDQEYALNEIAQISRKNPSLVMINMINFPQAIKAVISAIETSGLNINPQQEGTTLYLPIPPLTREHRENLSKSAKSLFIKTSDELKDVQNDMIRQIRKKQENFSEDLIYNAQQQVMKITQSFIAEGELIMQKKQSELLGK